MIQVKSRFIEVRDVLILNLFIKHQKVNYMLKRKTI